MKRLFNILSVLLAVVLWSPSVGAQSIRIWKDGSYQEFQLSEIDSINVQHPSEPVAVTGVTLDHNALSLRVGQSIQLQATVEPANATEKGVKWVTSNKSVVSVTQDGQITALKEGSAYIVVKDINGVAPAAKCVVTVSNYAAVDLGLTSGTKWSSMNLGAKSETAAGFFFAWGETQTKTTYTLDNYTMTDTLDVLDSSRDVASQMQGSEWSIPTEAQMRELLKECTWSWTNNGGVKGYLVKGPNGNTIFLPCTGYYDQETLYYPEIMGYYWTSTISRGGSQWAYNLQFGTPNHSVFGSSRFNGYPIRPVTH